MSRPLQRDAFRPYALLNVLKPVADDIWIVDGPEVRMSFAGLRLPFGTRMTMVRLPDGGLWLHSPIAPDDGLVADVRARGPVRALVAPNGLHHTYVPDWKDRFPDARVFVAPSPKPARTPLLPAPEILSIEAPSLWAGTLDQVCVTGGVFSEVAFFHRPSRTLILTDLIENFELSRVRSLWLRLVIRLGGAVDPDGKAPLDMQLSFARHRPALRAAVETMLAWAPERIVFAHGRWYDRNGVAELRRAFRWVL